MRQIFYGWCGFPKSCQPLFRDYSRPPRTIVFLSGFAFGGCNTSKDMLADNELLRRYCADRSESAFAELVERHADLVYSTALHHLNGNPDLARDVTQVVFTDLALKAASLRPSVSLAGWFYTSARFAAAKLVRSEQRRQAREQKALAMDKLDSGPGSTSDDPARLRPSKPP